MKTTMTCTCLLGLLPLVLYFAVFGGAPQIHAAEALAMLDGSSNRAALVDARPQEEYQARRITGALSLPLEQIVEIDSADELPPDLQGKTLLLVCDAGVRSAQAARHLAKLGVTAYSLRGGMQDWGRAWPEYPGSSFSRFELASGVVEEPFREMTEAEQGAAALAMLLIKPTYMLLSGALSFFLLRLEAADLRLLGWGLLVFLIGEVACAVNYIFLRDNSYLAEYLHSYSMALAFGLAACALLEGLDRRLVHFSEADRQCALLPVCGPCAKYQPTRCGVRRVAQFTVIALVILALIPMLAPFSYTAYNTQIGPVTHYYIRPFVHQWFEARFSPLAGIAQLGLALMIMQRNPSVTIHPLARLLFCSGAGFLGFGLFRVTLGLVYAEALAWATFWEEATELLFIGAVIYFLWIFRSTLLPEFRPRQVSKKVLP
ncbi:MAG: rhodanese-like domain-containing protein [Chloroflexi bacterium]|nr:rhodanese-like domain-containing protein [Chloroflexota bacterium]